MEVGRAILGTLREDGGCIWLELENGDEVRVIWPLGYSAAIDPFAVYDDSGSIVAKAGESILAEGSDPASGGADDCGRTEFVVLAEPVIVEP